MWTDPSRIPGIKALITLRCDDSTSRHPRDEQWIEATIKYNIDYHLSNIRTLADNIFNTHDMAAPITSGLFWTDGMIMIPCTTKTLTGTTSDFRGHIGLVHGRGHAQEPSSAAWLHRWRLGCMECFRSMPLTCIHQVIISRDPGCMAM